MAEAKAGRCLRLAGVLVLVLAPRGLGTVAVERTAPRMPAPRPGSIAISPAALEAQPALELGAPDLRSLALRTELAGGFAGLAPPAPAARPLASALFEPVPFARAELAGQPVAEPPAAWLLSLAGGAWLATRRARHHEKRGGRFSRNASMPSMASRSSRLSAITPPASR